MSLVDWVSMLANVATILGVPVAIFLYITEMSRQRREREYGTYDALDAKYSEYLGMVMDNPELDLYDVPLDPTPVLSPEQKIRQYCMFEILVSLLERAFLMYRDQSNAIKKTQWQGWNAYMVLWAQRRTFRDLWQGRGEQYDEDFMRHLNGIVQTTQADK